MSMTKEEYNNLDVGDWILFTKVPGDVGNTCNPLLDGKPHQIVNAGTEFNTCHRLTFDEVIHSKVFKYGWVYNTVTDYMTKVNPPTTDAIDYITLDIQKEIDLIIPLGD